MKELFKYIIKLHWKKIIIILFLQIIATFSQFMSVYVMGLILNQGVKHSNMNLLVSNGVDMLLLTIIAITSTIITYYLAVSVASDSAYEIRERLYDTYSKVPINEVNSFKSTGLMSRSTRGVYTIRAFIYNFLSYAILLPLVSVGLFLDFYDMHRNLGIAFIILLAILIIYLSITVYYACNGYFTVKKTFGSINFLFRQGALLFSNIRNNTNEELEADKFIESIEDSYDKSLYFKNHTGYITPIFLLLFNLSIVVLLYLSSLHLQYLDADLIELMMLFQYIVFFISTVKMLPQIINLFIRVNATSKRIEEVFVLEDTIKENSPIQTYDSENIIEFKNVKFKYGDKSIFEDLSFSVDKNSKVAIVGRIASGKSTILSLICGLYEIDDGQILIDNNDINLLSQEYLQDKISFATQKSFVINDTLRANIVLSDESITTDKILGMSHLSLLDECYDNFEEHLNDLIYENASNISDNAKDRLNITRCLLHKSDIYIFDNILTTYTDEIEYKVYEKIKNLLKNKTLLLVTENIDILKDMDKIIVLDDDEIIIGNHDELVFKSEYYQMLCEIQEGDMDGYD